MVTKRKKSTDGESCESEERRVTLKDIARRLGIGAGTVSMALNDDPRVRHDRE